MAFFACWVGVASGFITAKVPCSTLVSDDASSAIVRSRAIHASVCIFVEIGADRTQGLSFSATIASRASDALNRSDLLRVITIVVFIASIAKGEASDVAVEAIGAALLVNQVERTELSNWANIANKIVRRILHTHRLINGHTSPTVVSCSASEICNGAHCSIWAVSTVVAGIAPGHAVAIEARVECADRASLGISSNGGNVARKRWSVVSGELA